MLSRTTVLKKGAVVIKSVETAVPWVVFDSYTVYGVYTRANVYVEIWYKISNKIFQIIKKSTLLV